MRTLSADALASLNDENTEKVWLALVTIEHPSLATPIRVVHNNEAITSRGNVYQAFAFQLILPGQGADGPGEMQLAIDNVDRVIVESVRQMDASIAADVTVEAVLADAPDVLELSFPPLKLRDVTYNAAQVTGFLRFEDLLTEPACETITPSRFPALF